MKQYADYNNNYLSDYNGSIIPQNSFNDYARKASSRIDYFVRKPFEVNDKIISATCEIAELLYTQNQLIVKLNDDKSTVVSETVGPHSKSYVNKSNLQNQRILSQSELETEIYHICLRWLSSSGLMSRRV